MQNSEFGKSVLSYSVGPGIKLRLSELAAGALTLHGHLAGPISFHFNVYALTGQLISFLSLSFNGPFFPLLHVYGMQHWSQKVVRLMR